MRISDWSSDVCSSDLSRASSGGGPGCLKISPVPLLVRLGRRPLDVVPPAALDALEGSPVDEWLDALEGDAEVGGRSEEHTSELQSLMRISYAVFCLKKKKKQNSTNKSIHDKAGEQTH